MADVQIQQQPGGANWVWALVVIVLLAVIGWLIFGGGYLFEEKTEIKVRTPAAGSSPGSGTSGSR
ncbi:MAG TPA: hypothetical protein VNL91_07580 [Thermoanaerobaculia bacterium]|nr:hypothetical protein [Thermoanaerobaculia bacterium]